jgi:hypothetical protein
MFLKVQYGRKATMPAQCALSMALRRHLEGLTFGINGFSFVQVFDEWPSYMDRFVTPSACVLPSSWDYVDALLSPTLLEDTWEPKGQQGWGLYKCSEIDCTLEVSIRASSIAAREDIMLGVEESFQDTGLLMSEAFGPRYGLLLPLPEYYSMRGRFALKSMRQIDDEDHSMREQRDAVVTVSAQTSQVKVGPVYPLNLTFQLAPDEALLDALL